MMTATGEPQVETRALVLGDTLVPHDALTRATIWTRMPEDERRREVMRAASEHDADALWRLTDAWLTVHGRAGARVSPHTRRNYRHGVRACVAAFAEEALLHPGDDAGALWLRRLEDAGLKAATVALHLAAGRALYRALRWARATDADPFRDVRVARDNTEAHERRKPYPDEQVEALLRVAEGTDRALVLLGAHAGLRVSEMLALTWRDVNLTGRTLVVRRGKGGKMRTVNLSRRLADELAALRGASGGGGGASGGRLFPYRDRATAWRHLARLCTAAGIDALGVHSLRHTAGTKMYRQTHDLGYTASHLGHSSVETARIYAKLADKGLATAVADW